MAHANSTKGHATGGAPILGCFSMKKGIYVHLRRLQRKQHLYNDDRLHFAWFEKRMIGRGEFD